MTDILERVCIETNCETLPSGERKYTILVEENCECSINPGPEGPEGGEFLSPYLEEPDPDCPDCGGYGRCMYMKEEIHPPLDDSPIPF